MKKKYSCPCKESDHVIDTKLPMARMLYHLIKLHGEIIPVTVLSKGTYLVPRIYIAIHGLRAEEIDTLGFEQVKNST